MNKPLAGMREEYKKSALRKSDVSPDPFEQFDKWFDDALKHNSYMANAMTLATTSEDGRPSMRIVLLKDFDANGFVFFTNYESQKSREMDERPVCSLLFWWADLERQIRIEGSAARVSRQESQEYFSTRPRGSQISGIASPQSQVLEHRHILEKRTAELERELAGKTIECPDFWGGYRLKPDYFEFWQGRLNRLHDRISYKLEQEGKWLIQRLAP